MEKKNKKPTSKYLQSFFLEWIGVLDRREEANRENNQQSVFRIIIQGSEPLKTRNA